MECHLCLVLVAVRLIVVNCRIPFSRHLLYFLARDVIYTSRAYATMSVFVRLSVCLSVTKVHWRIITNLGFKFRSTFTAHCGRRRGACGRIVVAVHVRKRGGIIAGKSGGIISRYASHC